MISYSGKTIKCFIMFKYLTRIYRQGPWTYDRTDVSLALLQGGFDTEYYLEACPYVVSNIKYSIISTKYNCCPEPFESLEVQFCVSKRKQDDTVVSHSENSNYGSNSKCRWPNCP